MAQSHRKLPTDRTIAFAAAVVSSKPADLSVRDYIALLNRHIAKGRRENALSAAYRHLDRSAYWRAECERAKDAYRAAEDARLDALREVDVLKAKLEVARSATGLGAKRKRADDDVVPFSRELKKRRQELDKKREVFLGEIVIEEVEAGDDDVGVHGLMRGLYQIGLHFKPGVEVDPRALTQHLCSATADVASVVLDALERQQPFRGSTKSDDLSATLIAAGRIVAATLAGFQKLLRVNESGIFPGQVTYALVQMYDRLLTGVDAISKAEVNAETSHDSCIASKKPKTKAGMVRVNIKDVPALNALAGLLSGVLKQLDANQPSHREIFEGIFSCIISKLGDRLYTALFTRPRGASVAAEIEEAITVNSGGEVASSPEISIQLRQAHLEAPYTIHLLKQALALAPSFLNQPLADAKSTKSRPAPKLSNVTKSSLSVTVRKRLQATLVNAVFGSEGLGAESDLFLSCLQMPRVNGPVVPVPRVKEVEIGEWFQAEVWRLLGWEVLGKEVEVPSPH